MGCSERSFEPKDSPGDCLVDGHRLSGASGLGPDPLLAAGWPQIPASGRLRSGTRPARPMGARALCIERNLDWTGQLQSARVRRGGAGYDQFAPDLMAVA